MTAPSAARTPFGFAEVQGATKRFNLTYNFFANCSIPLTWLIANYTRLSANSLTRIGGLAGLAGSALLWFGYPGWAALAFTLFLLLDCSDGAIARLKGEVSEQGASLDLFWDRTILFVAVLSRCALLSGVSLLLCAAYLCLHYVTDLQWLMRLEQQAKHPAQWPELRAALHEQLPLAPQSVSALAKIYRAVRPDAWVCNIVFLLLPCLLPAMPLVSYGIAVSLLALTIIAGPCEQWLRRHLRARA